MEINNKGVVFTEEEKAKGCIDYMSGNFEHSLFYAMREACQKLIARD